jgi:AcrR family transcriptional regulator
MLVKSWLRTEIRREQIIKVTQRIILESGIENLTIRAIAAKVGITEGTVYRHFESKRDILSALLDDIGNGLLGGLENSLVTGNYAASAQVTDCLRRTFFNQVLKLTTEDAVAFHIVAEVASARDSDLSGKYRDILNGYISNVRNILALGVKTGEFRENLDLDSAAMLFFGMVESVSHFWLLNGYEFDLEEKARPMWKIFESAIAKSEDYIKVQ